MILLIAGMRRSGSTVAFQIAFDMVGGQDRSLGYTDKEDWTEKIIKGQAWYVAKTHSYLESMQEHVDAGRVRVLNTVRDPRDVCVSIMNLQGKTFQETMDAGLVHMAVNEQVKWEENDSDYRYTLRYEDFYDHLRLLARDIGWAMGMHHGQEYMALLAKKFSLEENKLRADNARNMRPDMLFHNHIQDGSVGQWRDRLTHEQLAEILEFAGPWMQRNGYTGMSLEAA